MFQQWKKHEIIINPALNLISYCYLYIAVMRVHDSNRKSNQFPYPPLPLPIQSEIFERSESSYHVFRWAIESCNCRRSDCHNSGCSGPPGVSVCDFIVLWRLRHRVLSTHALRPPDDTGKRRPTTCWRHFSR